jgi:uncharacterized repeat protein (TIGR01451 family)
MPLPHLRPSATASRAAARRAQWALALWLAAGGYAWAAAPATAAAIAISPAIAPGLEARLQAGTGLDLIVEFDAAPADAAAGALRRARGLDHDDAAVVAARAARYRATKAAAEQALRGSGAAPLRDYAHLPLALWHVGTPAALARLRAHPSFRAAYEDRPVAAVATPSDLALIQQPAAAAAGATGAGTTVVVIDAGINLANSAFGSCPTYGVAGCRILYNLDYYPGSGTDVNHGTNVSGIVAETATATRIAMHNVFNGASAASSDILTAIDWAIANQAADTIVAINMSLGDGGNYTASCSTVGGGGNPLQSAVATAAAAGIQTVAASGNNAYAGGINFPACTPGVVSVGAVYDSAIGGVSYPGVPCTDTAPAADQVTCFTNMASFLTVLAPGAAVTAAGITESGTSQASPHVAGVLAGLRGLYPREPLSQAVTRLTLTGVGDARSGITIPRIDAYAAASAGAQLQLSGSGPATATAGSSASYVLTVKNLGPLIATGVAVTDTLPALAVFQSGPGCTAAGLLVSCTVASLAVGASTSFTITVRWSASGPVYDSATASAQQIDPNPASATVAFGTAPAGAASADVPLPAWSLVLLGTALAAGGLGLRRRGPGATAGAT